MTGHFSCAFDVWFYTLSFLKISLIKSCDISILLQTYALINYVWTKEIIESVWKPMPLPTNNQISSPCMLVISENVIGSIHKSYTLYDAAPITIDTLINVTSEGRIRNSVLVAHVMWVSRVLLNKTGWGLCAKYCTITPHLYSPNL